MGSCECLPQSVLMAPNTRPPEMLRQFFLLATALLQRARGCVVHQDVDDAAVITVMSHSQRSRRPKATIQGPIYVNFENS